MKVVFSRFSLLEVRLWILLGSTEELVSYRTYNSLTITQENSNLKKGARLIRNNLNSRSENLE